MTNNKRFMNNTDTPINEREIVLRLIDGDEDAFCELYATYKNRLLYSARRAFPVNWQGRRFIDPNASFSSYLYTIMRNRILNQIRNMEKEDTLKESILSQAIDYSDDTKNNILSGDLKNIIQKAFESLTPRQQEIFRMSREELLSHKEIADKLGISIHTVQEHISLALHTIRTYLTKYSDTYADLLLILICMNL